jgi:hypothetical protein
MKKIPPAQLYRNDDDRMLGLSGTTKMNCLILPASNGPTSSPSPMARAPSIVAMRKASRAGITVGSPYLLLLNSAVSFISLNTQDLFRTCPLAELFKGER